MGTVVHIPFEVTGREPQPIALRDAGAVQFGRVRLRRPFTGAVDGAHGAPSGVLLPGTGTGEHAGIRRTVAYEPDETGSVPTLDGER